MLCVESEEAHRDGTPPAMWPGLRRGLSSRARQPQSSRRFQGKRRGTASQLVEVWSKSSTASLDQDQLRESTIAALPILTANELTALLHAIDQSRAVTSAAPPWDTMWRLLQQHATPKLRELKTSSLATWASVYASTGFHAPHLFDGIAAAAPSRMADGSCSPSDVTNLAWSFAHCVHPAPRLFRDIASSTVSRLEMQARAHSPAARDFRPAQLSTLMWAYAAADEPAPALFASDAFVAFIERATAEGGWSEGDLHRLHQYQLWCDERAFHAGDASPLPTALRARCAGAFGEAPPTVSLFQKQVGDTLGQLGLESEHEVRSSSGYSLDLVVSYNGLRVGVEADGPSHFLGDSERPTGATVLKRRQLRHFGWPLLPVPYFEFVGAASGDGGYAALDLGEALAKIATPTHRAYHTLNLNPVTATTDDIKSSYRRCLLAHHPDTNRGDTEAPAKTQAVIEAYRVLTSSEGVGAWQAAREQAAREQAGRDAKANAETAAAGAWVAEIRAEARRHSMRMLREAEADEERRAEAGAAEKARVEAEARYREAELVRAEATRRAAEERAVKREADAARTRERRKQRNAERARVAAEDAAFFAHPEGTSSTAYVAAIIANNSYARHLVVGDPYGKKRVRPTGRLGLMLESSGEFEQRGEWVLVPAYTPRVSFLREESLPHVFALFYLGPLAVIVAVAAHETLYQSGLVETSLLARMSRPTREVLNAKSDAEMQHAGTAPESDEFVPSAMFDGAKAGYVFKQGEYGLGFYRDAQRPPPPPRSLLRAAMMPPTLTDDNGPIAVRAAIHAALVGCIGHLQGPTVGIPFPRGAAYGAALGVTIAVLEGSMAVGVSQYLSEAEAEANHLEHKDAVARTGPLRSSV